MSASDSTLTKNCLNCGTPLTGKYCSNCGQKDIPRRQSLGDFLGNFVGSFTSFETKFFRTAIYLITRPGYLAVEFNKGKRESFYHPARAYVFLSFIFFLLFYWDSADKPRSNSNTQWTLDTGDTTIVFGEDTYTDSLGWYQSVDEYEKAQQALPEGERDGFLEYHATRRGIELDQKYKGRHGDMIADGINNFLHSFPKLLFFLLPIYSLLLKLLYVRKDYYFSEHLVFTVTMYNFFYFISSFGIVIDWIFPIWAFPLISLLLLQVYVLLSMKRMYQQGWLLTLVKYTMLSTIFSVVTLMVGFVSFMYTMLTL